jgi:hypothetical protein
VRKILRSAFAMVLILVVGGLLCWAWVGARAETAESHDQGKAARGEKQKDQKEAANPDKEEKAKASEHEAKEEKEERARHEGKGEKEEEKKPSRISHGPKGEVIVALDAETQQRMDLETKPLAATTQPARLAAYGLLQADPARSFTLRAPVAGILAAETTATWPTLGQTLQAGAAVGVLQPRLSPVERTDLATRLATAKGDIDDIRAQLPAAKASYDSKHLLNLEKRVVSDLALKEAEAKLNSLEARLIAALEMSRLLDGALAASTRPAGAMPLALGRAGEVVEVTAQPGESVEAGQVILQIARFDRLIARVDLPAGEAAPATLAGASIAVAGHESRPFRGERIGLAPAAGSLTRGQGFLFAIQPDKPGLRPGMPVTAYLDLPGEPLKGVIISRSGVVRYAGKAWVYVQTDKEKFTRREVVLDHATPEGWLVTSGLAAGDRLVVKGAQSLLSEELKAQTGEEEE